MITHGYFVQNQVETDDFNLITLKYVTLGERNFTSGEKQIKLNFLYLHVDNFVIYG